MIFLLLIFLYLHLIRGSAEAMGLIYMVCVYNLYVLFLFFIFYFYLQTMLTARVRKDQNTEKVDKNACLNQTLKRTLRFSG